jgi:hypothetical protein
MRLPSLPSRRPVRWLLIVALLLLVAAAGRWGEVAWQSLYFGERGPYLQVLTPHGVTIRWQTAGATEGPVRYGLAPEALGQSAADGKGRAHEVVLTGLQPGTRYFYAVGDGTPRPFTTPPLPGAAEPVRLWVFGDSGEMGPRQEAMRRTALAWMAAHPLEGRPLFDAGIALGDNAYDHGSNPEYQAGFFAPFADLLGSYMIWPVYGNHDARRWAYFRVFTLPTGGEAGGVASGSENYYSVDQGPVHLVVLDSEASDRSAQGPMAEWLRRDLAANKLPWLVVAFHHPPYTRGGHDSDKRNDSSARMFEMRENILPILEGAGVDLVLSGHSHDYERSQLMDCHYGLSATLKPEMVVERGAEGAVFHKASAVAPHEGEVLVVAGSGSRLDSGPLNHPAMAVSDKKTGSLVIDVKGLRLDARFIDADGAVRDSFTIEKGAGPGYRHPSLCR